MPRFFDNFGLACCLESAGRKIIFHLCPEKRYLSFPVSEDIYSK